MKNASRRNGLWLGLGLALLLAAVLRFYRLGSLPPGLWFDEAWASLQARDLLAQPAPPVYFPADFGGLHPAIVYLTALARWLMGGDPLAIRYGVAAAGVATAALTFFVLRAIFEADEETQASATVAALGGALVLALTFPFLVLTRIGFETVLPAIPACLVFLFLARAVRAGSPNSSFAWAGLALGLSLYTYYSARLLPAAVILALLWVAWTTRRYRRSLVGLGIVALFAAIVFLPLGVYFLQNWEQFTGRTGVTSYHTLGPGASSVPRALLSNLLHTLAGFSLPGFGDELVRHNIPGRPIYDPFLSLLFWLGVVALARRPRQARSALLLSWAGVMLLPTILTDGAPTFTRLLGAVPAFAGIAALGARELFHLLRRLWLRGPAPSWLAPAVLVAGLATSASFTIYDYFGRWAHDPGLYDAFQVGEWQAAALARERLEGGPVYLIPDLVMPARPAFDLLLRGSGVKAAATGCPAFFDRPAQPVTYLVDAREAGDTLDRLPVIYAGQGTGEQIIHPPTGATLFAVYTVPAGAPAAFSPQPEPARFGPLALASYDVTPAQPRPGEALTVRLTWQATSAPPADYTVFVHLYAAGQEAAAPAAQSDQAPCGGAYPTSRWAAGEIVVDEHTLVVPAGLAGKTAVLAVGAYSWPSLERLPLQAEGGMLPGARLRLAELPIDEG